MKILKIDKQIKHDLENRRYTFECLFLWLIPIKMICDWKHEGFMYQEYYLLNKLFLKKKYETYTYNPKYAN